VDGVGGCSPFVLLPTAVPCRLICFVGLAVALLNLCGVAVKIRMLVLTRVWR
jgi:hypothetical protein